MEAEQRQQAADRAKTNNEQTVQQARPKWMDRVNGAQDAQGTPAQKTPEQKISTQKTLEQTTSDAAQDRAAQQKQADDAREIAARTAKAAQEHQKLVDAAREQQKQSGDAKEKAATQPKQAAQPVVVIPQLVGVR
jgi:hypothetical protein